MSTKNGDVQQRAWRILRLALLWARKGGVLRAVPKFLKSLAHSSANSRADYFYGERQLSFDKTPMFDLKMHRPASLGFHFPCITPRVDFDRPADDHRFSFLKDKEEEENEKCWEMVPADEIGIDSRAEEFIAKFYEQMKLQRQISFLRHNEMLNTSTN